MKFLFVAFLTFSIYLCQAQELVITKIPGLFFTDPVDMESTNIEGDNRLFVLEKSGVIKIIEDPSDLSPAVLSTPFMDISNSVNEDFEGGLLGLAFHPDFATNGYIFVNYTFNDSENGGQFSTRISRFSIDGSNPNVADVSSEMEVITIPQPAKNHNGGDIAFGPDGFLYIPLGDGGGAGDEFKTAQNRQTLLGKVLRIDIDTEPYAIPTNNPFAMDDETLDEIWSLGWRNPWKIAFDRETGDFWAADVGQNTIEELDFKKPDRQVV